MKKRAVAFVSPESESPRDGVPAARHVLTIHDREHEIEGTLIARASTWKASGSQSKRWMEADLYRRHDGDYALHKVARSIEEGEADLHIGVLAGAAPVIFEKLLVDGKLTGFASDLLRAGGAVDAEFAEQLDERLDVEDIGGDEPGAEIFEYARSVPRKAPRSLRFAGKLLGRASSRRETSRAWLEVIVHRSTIAGAPPRYIVVKQKVSEGRDGALTPEISAVWVVESGAEAFVALTRQDWIWREATMLDALAAAADADERFAETVDPMLADLDSTRPQVPVITGPRLSVLRQMMRGASLLVRPGERLGRVELTWKASNAAFSALAEPPHHHLFMTLSRQRLIRRVPSQSVGEYAEWIISDLGARVYEASELRNDEA